MFTNKQISLLKFIIFGFLSLPKFFMFILKVNFKFCLIISVFSSLIACNSNKIEKKTEIIDTSHQILSDERPVEEKELSKIINQSPDKAEGYHARAKYFIKNRKLEDAWVDLSKAFELDSANETYFLTLSDYYLTAMEPAKSKGVLMDMLNKNPNNAEAHLKLGELYYYGKKYDQSFGEINKALRLDKYLSRAYFFKGMNYKETGNMEKAISSFQTATEQNPDYVDAYMQLGLLNSGNNSKLAIQYFASAISTDPKNIDALYARAYEYQISDDFDKAIQDYTKIIQIKPEYADAHFNLGYIHYNLDLTKEALKDFEKVIKYAPEDPKGYYMRGLCYESGANDSKALEDFRKALSLRPDYELASKGINRIEKK